MPTLSSILWFLLLGALAGWLAGKLVRGYGFGLIANILIGVLGALLGGFIFEWAGWATGDGFLWSLLVALVGAVVLLLVTGLIGRISGHRR